VEALGVNKEALEWLSSFITNGWHTTVIFFLLWMRELDKRSKTLEERAKAAEKSNETLADLKGLVKDLIDHPPRRR
jgi:hypothetical protein